MSYLQALKQNLEAILVLIHSKGKNKAQVYDVIGAHGFPGDEYEHGNDKPISR